MFLSLPLSLSLDYYNITVNSFVCNKLTEPLTYLLPSRICSLRLEYTAMTRLASATRHSELLWIL